jgi:hypothetical protein
MIIAVGDIVDRRLSHLSNPKRIEEKPRSGSTLAEPFPGTVAQGVSLPKVREKNALSVGQNQRAAQIR